jgi:hypothetical protein
VVDTVRRSHSIEEQWNVVVQPNYVMISILAFPHRYLLINSFLRSIECDFIEQHVRKMSQVRHSFLSLLPSCCYIGMALRMQEKLNGILKINF